MDLSNFLEGYITCALWSSTDDEGEPLDDIFGADDLRGDILITMREDCADFISANAADLDAYEATGNDAHQAGRDFWLTRNRHGTGFWDRGLRELGERLSAAAKIYGSFDIYIDDDGNLYGA